MAVIVIQRGEHDSLSIPCCFCCGCFCYNALVVVVPLGRILLLQFFSESEEYERMNRALTACSRILLNWFSIFSVLFYGDFLSARGRVVAVPM